MPATLSQPTTPADRSDASRWMRRAFWLSQLLVVVPVWVAALRNGHQGWYPTLDAANTVLRARDVIGPHTPLIGMWSSVSIKAGAPTYFPGATELYLLSIPIHLFGNSWGPLLGMAVINTAWLCIAGWLLRRRLGALGASWGLFAVALLLWTMGSEALIDVAPMQMVTIPFAVFIIAVWSVADRDLTAIPILAVLANYLLLNHLVLTFLIPVIGVCAPIALVITMRNARRREPKAWPGLRRRLIRQLLISCAITVVMWLPPVIQQLTNNPGNLTNLWRASQVDLHRTVSAGTAVSVVVSMLSVPPFWLRNTYDTPLSHGPGGAGLIVLCLVIAAVVVALGVLAFRRRDRTTLTLLGVAVVAVVAGAVNVLAAPTDYGFKRAYFRSLWGTSMLAWFAIVVGVVRALPVRSPFTERHRQAATAVGVAAVLVVAMLAVPHKDPGRGTNGTSDASVALANKVLNRAVVLLRHRGQVQVAATGDFSSFAVSSALILALDTNGVDVCVPTDMVAQFGAERACNRRGADVYAVVSSAAFPAYPGEYTLVEATLLSSKQQRVKRRLDTDIAHWLATQTSLHAGTRVRANLVDAYGPQAADQVEAHAFDTKGLPLESLVFSPDFVDFVAKRSVHHKDGSVDAAIKTPGLPPEDLVQWAEMTKSEYTGGSTRISTANSPPMSPAPAS